MIVAAMGCTGDSAEPGLNAITTEAFDAHLRFLSSDFLEGRGTGTRGSEQATAYISNQYELAGLVPAVGDSSYLQPVPMIARTADGRMAFRAPGGASFEPEFGEDFVAWSSDTAAVSVVDAELVFVGYGITAPEWDWDDYEDVDVSGRVLLILANDPGSGSSNRFMGDTLTYYGLSEYKFAEAERRGAAGAFLIHTAESTPVTWEVIRTSLMREKASLDVAPDSGVLALQGWMAQEAAEQVVAMARLDFQTLLETARSDNFRPVFTGARTTAEVRSETRSIVDHNVAGILRGSDPELAQEFVVITAHHDHLGIGEAVNDDSIYNGAYDNASGTALLICLADAFGRLPQRPARSILFLAVTGEESGLLGSRFYTKNPLVPLTHTVLNINIDGGNLWGATEDLAVLGAELTDIRRILVQAARAENLRLEGDPAPEQGFLYRSDQLSFLQVGVPAIVVGHGFDFIGRMPGWGDRMFSEYIDVSYHRPSDEYRSDLDLRGAVQQGRIALRVGVGVANRRERPATPHARWSGGEVPNDQ
jgi:Zn-dependent M28 family amino/carboxypeptidase